MQICNTGLYEAMRICNTGLYEAMHICSTGLYEAMWICNTGLYEKGDNPEHKESTLHGYVVMVMVAVTVKTIHILVPMCRSGPSTPS